MGCLVCVTSYSSILSVSEPSFIPDHLSLQNTSVRHGDSSCEEKVSSEDCGSRTIGNMSGNALCTIPSLVESGDTRCSFFTIPWRKLHILRRLPHLTTSRNILLCMHLLDICRTDGNSESRYLIANKKYVCSIFSGTSLCSKECHKLPIASNDEMKSPSPFHAAKTSPVSYKEHCR